MHGESRVELCETVMTHLLQSLCKCFSIAHHRDYLSHAYVQEPLTMLVSIGTNPPGGTENH